MKKFLLLFVSFHFTLLILSQTIRVPEDYPTIQQGIDASNSGDTVLVNTGTYYLVDTPLNYYGKGITVASLFLITQDTTYIQQTKIVAYEGGTSVLFETGEDSTSILSGFTIREGYIGIHCKNNSCPSLNNLIITNIYYYEYASEKISAIYCESSSPRIEYLKIHHNDVELGSWIDCNNSNPLINNVLFEINGGSNMISVYNNSNPTIKNIDIINNGGRGIAIHGAPNAIIQDIYIAENSTWHTCGFYISGSPSPTIKNVTIINNTTTSTGCGIYCYHSSPIIQNSVISNNSVYFSDGGGIYTYSSNVVLQNVLITNNDGGDRGGGISCWYSNLTLENVTISNNYADVGGAIWSNGSSIEIINSILWDNTPDEIYEYGGDTILISYSDIKDGWSGENNIDQDPLFTNLDENPYQIDYYSPCIDKGTTDTTGLNLPEYDLAGEVRIFNCIVDMGAYEWNTFVGIYEPISHASTLKIQTYPNPIITSTTFKYELQQASSVQITIYNHLGEQVEEIHQNQSSGPQQIIWNAEGLPSGVYYFRLQTGDKIASGKMVVVE